ncbi:MAG: type VI secretion system baseplate subunit TssE [Myxococcales bacterium]|nr:type VI secretion system baseplate subunit TssE [Myxococcales bacterium]
MRFLPSLLDRLTRDEDDGWVTADVLRETVRRDLEWLLNTPHFEQLVPLHGLEHVRTSVLNYGVRSVVGHSQSQEVQDDLVLAIARALKAYDSRLRDVRVEIDERAQELATGSLAIRIEADLMVQPEPVHVRVLARRDEGFRVALDAG